MHGGITMVLSGVNKSTAEKYPYTQNMISSVVENEKKQDKEKEEHKEEHKATNIINVSSLNLEGQKSSAIKELFAKKTAWKLQEDQFKKDLKVDEKLMDHVRRRDDLIRSAGEDQSKIRRINDLKIGLKETFEVDQDSEEQKNLELLEKKMMGDKLTEKEYELISKMGPLTEYQKASLEYSSMAKTFQDRIDTAIEEASNIDRSIIAINLGLLASNPMLDAKKDAEKVLETLDGEIQKAIMEELRNKVNDKLDINPQDQILLDPKKLIQQKKVTEEDLKGLAVDEKL